MKDKKATIITSKIYSRQGWFGTLYADIVNWSKISGTNVYLVGGAVRDILLSGNYKDLDFCIEDSSKIEELISYLSELRWRGDNPKYVHINKIAYPSGTVKISVEINCEKIPQEIQFEIAVTRKEVYDGTVRRPSKIVSADVHEDALRRDFNCNAVYFNIVTEELIDPTGKGIHDINSKVLRTVKDPKISFREDPLRMIRCIRFSLSLGFEIERDTLDALKNYPEYESLSIHLIRPEFETSLLAGGSKFIRILHEKRLLGHIIPELEESWGFNQNSPYHSMNLTDHLLTALDWVLVKKYFNKDLTTILAYSTLLHDIGKYKCFQLTPTNHFSFHNHENISSDLSKEILRRLGYGKSFVESVSGIIRCHMMLKPWWDSKTKQLSGTRKQWKRTFDRMVNLLDLDKTHAALALIDADNNTHAPEYCRPNQVEKFIDSISKSIYNPYTDFRNVLPGIDEIISLMDLKSKVRNSGRTAAKIRKAMEDIIPLQLEWTRITKEEILGIYSSVFEDTLYIVRDFATGKEVFFVTLDQNFKNMIEVLDSGDIAEFSFKFQNIQDNSDHTPILELESKYYPDLLMRCRVNQDVNRIVGEIREKVRELKELPGYSRLSLNDVCGDLSAAVEFTNRDRIVIIP